MIALTAGDWRATLAPDMGGAMLSLDWRGRPVLRPTPDGATDILQTSCFPLVPYANRIANGRFVFEGRSVRLPVLERFASHAIHGEGWLQPWTIQSRSSDVVAMTLDWQGEPAGWPWPWRAKQVVSLADSGLEIELSVTNAGDEIMPAGLGLHPYFHRHPHSRLALTASGVLATNAFDLPDRFISPLDLVDWSSGRALNEVPFVDHAYGGWNGVARMTGGSCEVVMKASSSAAWVQVYAPTDTDFFCVEPVTHCPDAFNGPVSWGGSANGLVALKPGETLTIHMTVSASARD
ncbi:aldose 1-epimerase [Brevundimonas sp. 374]|uniref:aldose 1-epimerase n=1 Tax=Brevundimonas sp. 374 TaxID=1150400 RepID=UPI00088BD16B|nr:aldose 1-epimerase [Brevundimonas sp. 374]SDR18325.1 aldose 1-epimerase [Brevundimonas sp. 374]